jgi:hypothetical protein
VPCLDNGGNVAGGSGNGNGGDVGGSGNRPQMDGTSSNGQKRRNDNYDGGDIVKWARTEIAGGAMQQQPQQQQLQIAVSRENTVSPGSCKIFNIFNSNFCAKRLKLSNRLYRG